MVFFNPRGAGRKGKSGEDTNHVGMVDCAHDLKLFLELVDLGLGSLLENLNGNVLVSEETLIKWNLKFCTRSEMAKGMNLVDVA